MDKEFNMDFDISKIVQLSATQWAVDKGMDKADLKRFIEAMQETLERQHQMMIEATRHDLATKSITPQTAIGQLLSYGVNNLRIIELFEQWGIVQE